jgi:hypothetical protein
MVIDFNYIGAMVQWIESHEHTVDLLKWIAVGSVAWLLGIFRAIREWARRPSIAVETTYSCCYPEKHVSLGQYTNVVLLAFIVDIRVINPTGVPLNVRKFELQVRRSNWLNRWAKPVPAIGFPSMPRTSMPGENMKVVPIWFTAFAGFDKSLSLRTVDPHDCSVGLAFFVAALGKNDVQKEMKQFPVRICVTFSSGEKRTMSALVDVKTDLSHLEERVPESLRYIRHESVWTYCA